jgi:hypothetical protein
MFILVAAASSSMCLLAVLLLLPLFVVHKVVENGGGVLIGVDNLENHLALVGRNFLRVPGVSDGLVFIVLQTDVPQLAVGHVLHVDPLDLELAFELVLHPYTATGVGIVHCTQHLRHAAKVARAVHREQQVDGPVGVLGLEGPVQSLVAVISRAPNLVLDAAVDVVLTEALDDKVASVLWTHVKALGVVVVNAP